MFVGRDIANFTSDDFAGNVSSGGTYPGDNTHVVRLVTAASGEVPRGRYHHSAVLIPVSGGESQCVNVHNAFPYLFLTLPFSPPISAPSLG